MTTDALTILRGILANTAASLAAMERAPAMRGGPEALELQWLQLVELRQRILRPAALAAQPYETRDAFCRFIAAVNGGLTATMLGCVLRDGGMVAELPRLLGDAARWIEREYPAEWTP